MRATPTPWGDLIAGRVTWRGTQAGPVAPSGQFVVFESYHIARFEDGIVAEWWGSADSFGALAQLGVLPGPD
jgi:predicted ester cyclase